jgi:hypothetical protein
VSLETQSVICPPPTRSREDEQIVEIFLHGYQDGRFADQPDWLPQHVSNVEAIASDRDGTRLAIEHTRVREFDFTGRQANPDEDEILGEVGLHMAGISLPVRDRAFMLSVGPKNFKKLLTKRYHSRSLGALTEWARSSLPPLHENQEFEIPIPISLPRKDRTVRIGVEVWQVRTDRPILPCVGYLRPRSEIVPRCRKALEDKLAKLTRAQADRRILMLELLTLAGDAEVYEAVRNLARNFPDFLRIDEVVFVRNFFEWGLTFRTWNTASNDWSVFVARVNDESR